MSVKMTAEDIVLDDPELLALWKINDRLFEEVMACVKLLPEIRQMLSDMTI